MASVKLRNRKKTILLLSVLLVALLVAASAATPEARFLIKVDWGDADELAEIASCDVDVRYCARGYVLLSVDGTELEQLRELGLEASVLDTSTAEEMYCIVQVRQGFEARVSSLGKPVLCDDQQRLILALNIPEAKQEYAFECLRIWCYFSQPLPHRMSLSGWLPDPLAPKPAYTPIPFPQVSALLDSVSVTRLEHDLARLVYYDITKTNGHYNNEPPNLRTRYARHPDCLDSAAAYIVAELSEALGDDAVELIEFRHTPEEVPMYNIVGVLEGADPGAGYYILGGHYDSIASRSQGWNWRTDPAPGADDNGTAVICALEAARILSDVTLPFTVKFVFFSGEELHLWGSQAYVEDAVRNADNIIAILNLDMVGYNHSYDKLDVVANPSSEWVMRLMGEMNDLYDIGLLLFEKFDTGFPSSDHWIFWGHGYDGIWGTEHLPPWEDDPDGLYRANPTYHTYNDVVDSLNFSLIRKTAQLCVATLAQFSVSASLPDLAICPGDIAFSNTTDALLVKFRNLSNAPVDTDFSVLIFECDPDSTPTELLKRTPVFYFLEAGTWTIEVPYQRRGEMTIRVDIDPDRQVVEADTSNNRAYGVLKWATETLSLFEVFAYPNPCSGDEMYFHYQLSQVANVRIEVFTAMGQEVWSKDFYAEEEGGKLGRNDASWTCRNMDNEQLASGLYMYKISAFEKDALEPSDYVLGKLAIAR